MELQPDRGLRNQRKGLRTTFMETMTPPPKLVNDGKAQIEANEPGRIDLKRKAQLDRLMPTYR